MKDLLSRLGKRIQSLRKAKNWSQEQFADVSGFHRTYVGQIERGEKNIAFANLVKIASVLGVSLSELLANIEMDGQTIAPATRKQSKSEMQTLAIKKVVAQLTAQHSALAKTIQRLDDLSQAPKKGR